MLYTAKYGINDKLHKDYDGTVESVIKLAKELGKSKKSIIGKMAKENIYIKTTYKTKLGEDPMTKKEMVEEIAVAIDYDYDQLQGMEKTPKGALKIIHHEIMVLTGSI